MGARRAPRPANGPKDLPGGHHLPHGYGDAGQMQVGPTHSRRALYDDGVAVDDAPADPSTVNPLDRATARGDDRRPLGRGQVDPGVKLRQLRHRVDAVPEGARDREAHRGPQAGSSSGSWLRTICPPGVRNRAAPKRTATPTPKSAKS